MKIKSIVLVRFTGGATRASIPSERRLSFRTPKAFGVENGAVWDVAT
jgi:hypothetical protein